MNDLLTTDDVEARLRRVLAARAEDVADGDLPAGGNVVSLPAAGTEVGTPGRRGRRRAALAAAAALVVGAGVAAVLLATGRGGDADPVTSDDPASTTTTTVAPGPTPARAMYQIGAYSRGGYGFEADFSPLLEEPWLWRDVWTPVQVGEHEGHYMSLVGLSELQILVDGGVVTLFGTATPLEEMVAVVETLSLDPSTGRYVLTPPEGWTTVSHGSEGMELPAPDGDPETSPGTPVGGLVDPADPDARHATVTSHVGTYRHDLPDDLEPVDLGGQTAYLEPGGDDGRLRLWVPHIVGLVEVDATGLSEEEVVAVGNGVALDGGENPDNPSGFTIAPLPGFELTG